MVKKILRRVLNYLRRHSISRAGKSGSASYWTAHTVLGAGFRGFSSKEESLDYFDWRNDQYPGYVELMPVSGYDGQVIVDYGCGPGNDLVGFSNYSNPKELIGVDVSKTALDLSRERLKLHDKSSRLILIEEESNSIPIESNYVDLIHSSGVLHHCANLPAVLKEFHRILKVDGTLNIMVYNYESIWLHLYTAYVQQIERGNYSNLDILEAFRMNTDGEFCPISHCYKPYDFISLMKENGFEGEFIGNSISTTEMKVLEKRFTAIENRQLDKEHRKFLCSLKIDEKGFPTIDSQIAGINSCFRFKKII